MKKFLVIAAVISFFTSCHQVTGSGNIITEKKDLRNFKGISSSGAFEVELKTGPAFSVEIEADDNLMKLVEVRVSGDVLKIDTRNNYSVTNGHFKAFVTAPEINMIKCSGASTLKALDILKSPEKMRFDVSGAGGITAEVDAPQVDAEVSGAGNIELTGRTRDYKAEASGAGNIKTRDLQSENAIVKTSGAGNIHVHSSVSLDAHASGAGNIFYRGGGSVNQHVSGAGSVKPEN